MTTDLERMQFLRDVMGMLNTPAGQSLMKELEIIWYAPKTLDPNSAQATAYNVGLNDAYRTLLSFQTGEFINDERQP